MARLRARPVLNIGAARSFADASGWLPGHHGKNIDGSALTLEWHLAEGLRRHAAVQRTLCGVIDE